MSVASRRFSALIQLLRIGPVMSWGVSALALGVGVAVARSGTSLSYTNGFLALALVVLAQGFVSHGLNDAYDWLTGTDKESIGKGTGGSRVIPQGKLSVIGTIGVALIALAGVIAIGGYFHQQYGRPILVLLGVAVWSPVAYSVPPLKLGYRPFNELVVVLPALAGVVVGTDLVLVGSLSPVAAATGVLHALFCISWFIVSRVPDYRPDKRVGKVTSVVYIGRENAGLLAAGYLALGLAVAAALAVTVSPVYLLAGGGWAWLMLGLSRLDTYDAENASEVRRRNMHSTTAHGILLAALLAVAGV